MAGITKNLNLQIVDSPKDAPNYQEDTTLIKIEKAIIVGEGMESGKPTVDLQCKDKDGNKYLIMTTGTLVEMLAGAVAGKRELDEQKRQNKRRKLH